MGRQHEADPDAKATRLSRESLHTYGRLLQYVRPYRRPMIFSITLLLFSTVLGLILPLVVQNLVDVVLIDKNLIRLNQLAIGLFVVFIVQALFSFDHQLTLAYVGERAIATIRVQIYSHLQSLSLKYFADHRTGEVVSRLTNDVSLLQSAVTKRQPRKIQPLEQRQTCRGESGLFPCCLITDWRSRFAMAVTASSTAHPS